MYKVSDRVPTESSKRIAMMIVDAMVIPSALWLAVVLRYGELYKDVTAYWWLFLLAPLVCIPTFHRFGLYRAIIRYIGPGSMLSVLVGVTVTMFTVSLLAYLTSATGFPRTAPLIFWLIAVPLTGGSRLLVRAYYYGLFNNYLTREIATVAGYDHLDDQTDLLHQAAGHSGPAPVLVFPSKQSD